MKALCIVLGHLCIVLLVSILFAVVFFRKTTAYKQLKARMHHFHEKGDFGIVLVVYLSAFFLSIPFITFTMMAITYWRNYS